jgi:hypothetical protein
MNCGPHKRSSQQAGRRADYDPKLLGVLGTIPHLSRAAYEIDRIDNTAGYCLRNMLRACFKHNCFIQGLEVTYGGARLSTGELQARLRMLPVL